jgi:glucose/arabinose dehydrogenase
MNISHGLASMATIAIAVAIGSCSPTETKSISATASTGVAVTQPSSPEPQDVTKFQKVTLASGLDRPWGMDWLPDGSILITERSGKVKIWRNGTLEEIAIANIPNLFVSGQAGLLDIALHPRFTENKLVYFAYSSGDLQSNRTSVFRAKFDGKALTDPQVIFEVSPNKSGNQHFGARIAWLPDETMLIAIGDGGNPPLQLNGELIRNQAQKLDSRLGKIVRIKDDGSIPADNPFVKTAKADPAVWSYGHRNIQGLYVDVQTGQIWSTEHGARGGDELNLVEAGKNYGWPIVTYSQEYIGGAVSDQKSRPDIPEPKLIWTPSIAPSGLTVYQGDRFPNWQGNIFAGGLVSRDVVRIKFENGKATTQESIAIGQRVRDVRTGKDGLIYILTDESNGQLIRLEPQ